MIIAISGFKRSGKDTCADYIVSNYGYERYGLADPMREFIKDVFGWDDNWINNHKEDIDPYWGISYRQIAQVIGTEWFQIDICNRFPLFAQNIGRQVWIKRFERLYLENPKDYIISDLRFPHEENIIRKLGGKIIKLEREGCVTTNHESELLIPSIKADYIIENNYSLDSLYDKLEYFMKKEIYQVEND